MVSCRVLILILAAAAALSLPVVRAAPTTGLPAATNLQLEDSQEVINNRSDPDPCTVSGVMYTHGQQVPRDDPCDLCLCLDGDLFCWWQDCSGSGPCRASACANMSSESSMGTAATTSNSYSPSEASDASHVSTVEVTTPAINNGTTVNTDTLTVTTAVTSCYVMGTEYRIGEVLPRDTGTCLECVCDSEARVTCSPKDCASHEDYRASNSLDMFDVDTF